MKLAQTGLSALASAGTPAVQEAGIPAKFASTIGIAVDNRRKNRSLESLQVRSLHTAAASKGNMPAQLASTRLYQ